MSAVLEEFSFDTGFRPMTEDDLDQVTGIEESIYDFPWTRGIFKDCLKIGYICRVLEVDGKVVAYSIMSTVVDEAHLLTIVVPESEQGKGYGSKTLEQMIKLSRLYKSKTMYLEVRVSNEKAINLYHNRGFNEIGMRKGYYPVKDGREDAVLMALDLKLAKLNDA